MNNALGLFETVGLVALINAVDAALKAAEVELAVWFAPPYETNFSGGYLVGPQSAVVAACGAFRDAVLEVAAALRIACEVFEGFPVRVDIVRHDPHLLAVAERCRQPVLEVDRHDRLPERKELAELPSHAPVDRRALEGGSPELPVA